MYLWNTGTVLDVPEDPEMTQVLTFLNEITCDCVHTINYKSYAAEKFRSSLDFIVM